MASYNKFNSFVEAICEKVHNLGSDTLKIALTLTAPTATDTQLSELTEITAGNGYPAGGNTITVSSSAQSSGTYKLVGADVDFVASGGSINDFRYPNWYNDTATNDELGGYWDYGSTVTLTDGNTFTVDLDATNGMFQLA